MSTDATKVVHLAGDWKWWDLPGADPLRLMTPAEAADYLGLRPPNYEQPVRTLLRWSTRGTIKSIHMGGRVWFNLEILHEHIRHQLPMPRKGR